MKPSDAALAKLMKYVEAGKGALARGSRLDTGRLTQLSEALASFETDEVAEIKTTPKSASQVSHSVANVLGKRHQQHTDPAEKVVTFTPTEHTAVKLPTDLARSEVKREAPSPPDSDDSDSSSSDSEEDGTPSTGLASLGKFVKSPRKQFLAKPRMAERRQIKVLAQPSVDSAMQERVVRNQQMRNAALRLRPNISGLHKAILSWDYNHNGPMPLEQKSMTQVANKFNSYQHYFQVFQPLLLAECWAQLSQAKEEAQDSYQCRVDSRQYADDWLDIDLTIIGSVKKGWYLAETDIVLLHQDSDRTKCLMAKVKTYKALPSGVQVFVRCYLRPGSRELGPQITTTWQINKLFRYATILFFSLRH